MCGVKVEVKIISGIINEVIINIACTLTLINDFFNTKQRILFITKRCNY